METQKQLGYLLLADISGYTSFMAGTELEHSQAIMSTLLTTIIEQLTPIMDLSEVEGDAVFVYAPSIRLQRGETLLELIEATYTSFRTKIQSMQRHTTCLCNACRSIPTLDLKFVAHFGSYILQSIAGRNKPVGSDINLIHRLLKNHVCESTGWKAYALFSTVTLDHIDAQLHNAHSFVESYEHLGEVNTISFDLHKRYSELMQSRSVYIEAKDAHAIVTKKYTVPPPVLWDWVNNPAKRDLWMPGTRWSVGARTEGRTGPGSQNHCAHGKSAAIEHIIDWKPFDYFTCDHLGTPIKFISSDHFVEQADGTLLEERWRIESKIPKWLRKSACRIMMKVFKVKESFDLLESLMKQEQSESGIEPELEPMKTL